MSTGASAQYTITKVSGDGQTGQPGQTLAPFVVEVSQNGSPAQGVFVTFLHDRGSSTGVPVQTDANGRAQSTLTLGRGAGVTTITASVPGGDSVTFTATAIIPTPPKPPPMNRLLIISGHGQTGGVGQPLAAPFAVRVRDPNNKPLEGVGVTFAVTGGGGTLSTTAAATDASGRAESTLTLGPEPGTNTVEVRASGISEARVFSAEATRPPSSVLTDLVIISGDNQSGMVGESLAHPFVVGVRDQFNDPISGVSVTFTVTEGGGSLSEGTVTTDTDGRAESTLTLGTEPGVNTVEASVEGISGTETFNAEATLPPPIPTAPSIISSQHQEGLTGETLMDPLVVEVIDQYGNPISGVNVTFTVTAGDGMLSEGTVTTEADGRAETTLTLGNAPGPNSVEASVEGVAETVTFTVIGELLEFDLSLPIGINLIHIPLKVRAVNGMPGVIGSVSDLYDVLGGAAAVNFLITHDPESQEWRSYFGEADRGGIGDAVLTDHTGIIASIVAPISVRLGGDALGTAGLATVNLGQGLNLVGLPLRDPRIGRVSDLFTLGGIAGNVGTIVVTEGGTFKLVGRAGDDGDLPTTGGQGFIMIAAEAEMITIIGKAWGE